MTFMDLWGSAANKSDESIQHVIDDYEKEVGKKFNADERRVMINQVRMAHTMSPNQIILSTLFSFMVEAHKHSDNEETFSDMIKVCTLCAASFGEMNLLDQIIPLCKDEKLKHELTTVLVAATEKFLKLLSRVQTLALLFQSKEDK